MRARHWRLLALAAIFVVGLAASCAGAAAPPSSPTAQPTARPAAAAPAPAPTAAPAAAKAAGYPSSDAARPAAAGQPPAPASAAGAGAPPASQPLAQLESGYLGRRVIRTANLRMVVEDVDRALYAIYDLVNAADGFILSSEATETGTDRTGRASLRVPGERMAEVLRRIREMATTVLRETGAAQDVTEEYVDQEARLRHLLATEAQYLKLLESAKTMDEILRVQQPLNQVREQVERTKGRMNYLERNTEMSTINVELVTSVPARPVAAEKAGAWSPERVLDEALRALAGVGRAAAAVGIWALVFSPLWGPLALVWLWVRRRDRRAASA